MYSRVYGVILGVLNYVFEFMCGFGLYLNKFIVGLYDYYVFLVCDILGYLIEYSLCLYELIVVVCLELRNKLDGLDGF